MKMKICLAVAAAAGVHAQASSVVYSDQAAFVEQLGAGHFHSDFSELPTGPRTSLSLIAGAFAAEMGAVVNGEEDYEPNNLWIAGGVVSTNVAASTIHIDFSSGNVTTVGGIFFGGELWGDPVPASLTFELDDGTTEVVSADGPVFVGFVSTTTITSLTIAADGSGARWPSIDSLWFGAAAVPLPSAGLAGAILLPALAARRRR